jgi:hypothetical protein
MVPEILIVTEVQHSVPGSKILTYKNTILTMEELKGKVHPRTGHEGPEGE